MYVESGRPEPGAAEFKDKRQACIAQAADAYLCAAAMNLCKRNHVFFRKYQDYIE